MNASVWKGTLILAALCLCIGTATPAWADDGIPPTEPYASSSDSLLNNVPAGYCVVDYVNVGFPTSEAGHNMIEDASLGFAWGPIIPGVITGGYGGHGTSGGWRFRCMWGYEEPDDGSPWAPVGTGNREADVDLDFGSGAGNKMIGIWHLDGGSDDAFDVYVDGVGYTGDPATGTPAAHYTAVSGGEAWFLDWYDLGALTGVHTITLMATGAPGTYWNHYGQVGIEEIATAMADSCDDGNACTDDFCGSYDICEHTNNTASCDDGEFCNGADTCADGDCTQHAGDPCVGDEVCNEDTDTCDLTGVPVILNEYNAVGSSKWLDVDGETASDAEDVFFGRVQGNGGNWIELVVTQDHLNMQGWFIDWSEDVDTGTITFTNDPLWSDLRAGTIITITESCTSEGGLDTNTSFNEINDWWININTLCGGVAQETYLTTTHSSAPNGSFSVGNDDFQMTIYDAAGRGVAFGPVGEGICNFDGVGSREVGKLEADPSPYITPCSEYHAGTSSSFGHPNIWGGGNEIQSFTDLRGAIIDIELIALSTPSAGDGPQTTLPTSLTQVNRGGHLLPRGLGPDD